MPETVDGIVGILLAAGLGTRYDPTGRRLKLLEPTADGVPIAAAAADALHAVVNDVVAVVRPIDSPLQQRLHRLLTEHGCRLAVCSTASRGMGASLAGGIHACEKAGGWIVALADMPQIAKTTIDAVAAAVARGATTVAPFHRGARGHPVGFGRVCLAELLALDGDAGARSVLQARAPLRIDVDDSGCLFDVDLVTR